MLSFIVRIIVNAVALLVIAKYSGGMIAVKSDTAAVIAALVLGLVNAFVRPVLYFIANMMTCVLSFITLGLWSLLLSWLINALLFYAVGQVLNGFIVKNFSSALWASLALSAVNALVTVILPDKEKVKD